MTSIYKTYIIKFVVTLESLYTLFFFFLSKAWRVLREERIIVFKKKRKRKKVKYDQIIS